MAWCLYGHQWVRADSLPDSRSNNQWSNAIPAVTVQQKQTHLYHLKSAEESQGPEARTVTAVTLKRQTPTAINGTLRQINVIMQIVNGLSITQKHTHTHPLASWIAYRQGHFFVLLSLRNTHLPAAFRTYRFGQFRIIQIHFRRQPRHRH